MSRRTRSPERKLRLRERDLDILLALGKMRLLRTSDLARLFFDAVGTCQKRLRKLFDAGLVRAVVTELAAENRYALTRLGHELLVEAFDEGEVPAWRPAPRLDARGGAHLDLLNRVRVALACSAPPLGVHLVRFLSEWEIRASDPRAPIIPDALVTIAMGTGTATLALEIDTGSEPISTVAKKVDAYARAELGRVAIFGVFSPRVVIVTSTARRARSVARALARGAADASTLVGAAPFVFENGGIATGLAETSTLAATDGPLGPENFRVGLLEERVREAGR